MRFVNKEWEIYLGNANRTHRGYKLPSEQESFRSGNRAILGFPEESEENIRVKFSCIVNGGKIIPV